MSADELHDVAWKAWQLARGTEQQLARVIARPATWGDLLRTDASRLALGVDRKALADALAAVDRAIKAGGGEQQHRFMADVVTTLEIRGRLADVIEQVQCYRDTI